MRLRRESQSTITKWLNSEIADQLKGAVLNPAPFPSSGPYVPLG